MDDSVRSWHHGLIARWWAERRSHLQPEILLMLEEAGFTDVRLESAYDGQPATRDTRNLVFIAVKPA